MTLLRCPECGKKGVRCVMRPRGEDGYVCRYCGFGAFTASEAGRIDSCYRWALQQVNPGEPVVDAVEEKPRWPRYLGAPEPWLLRFVEWEGHS